MYKCTLLTINYLITNELTKNNINKRYKELLNALSMQEWYIS